MVWRSHQLYLQCLTHCDLTQVPCHHYAAANPVLQPASLAALFIITNQDPSTGVLATYR